MIMNRDYLYNFLFFIVLPVCIILVVVHLISSTTDIKVWKALEKHTDEFVYESTSMNGRLSTVILYDTDSSYVCEVLLDHHNKKTSVFNKMSIIASSFNVKYSKRIYKSLVGLVPKKEINEFNPKGEVLNRFQKMK